MPSSSNLMVNVHADIAIKASQFARQRRTRLALYVTESCDLKISAAKFSDVGFEYSDWMISEFRKSGINLAEPFSYSEMLDSRTIVIKQKRFIPQG